MNSPRSLDSVFLALYFVCGLSFAAMIPDSLSQEQGESFTEAISTFELKRAHVLKPIVDLEDKYDSALGRLQEKMQKSGDLDAVLAIRMERENFRTGRYAPDAPQELLSIRRIFREQLQKVGHQTATGERVLIAETIRELEAITEHLTKQGQIQEAIKVGEKIDQLRSAKPLSVAMTDPPIIWELIDKDDLEEGSSAIVTVENGNVVVRVREGAPLAKVMAARTFATPFKIRWVVSVESGEVRLFAMNGFASLNHKSERSWLLINDFAKGGSLEHRFDNEGRIAPGEYHEIELEVQRERFVFRVDGKVRGEGIGDYSQLKGSIGIGTSTEGSLTIQLFEIRAPLGY